MGVPTKPNDWSHEAACDSFDSVLLRLKTKIIYKLFGKVNELAFLRATGSYIGNKLLRNKLSILRPDAKEEEERDAVLEYIHQLLMQSNGSEHVIVQLL